MKKDTIIALTQAEGIDNGVGVAYYRLTKEMKEFLEKCLEKNNIVGFEWEVGSYNFGVILK